MRETASKRFHILGYFVSPVLTHFPVCRPRALSFFGRVGHPRELLDSRQLSHAQQLAHAARRWQQVCARNVALCEGTSTRGKSRSERAASQ